MSLDLYQREIQEKLDRTPKTSVPDVHAWDGFARGTAMSAMQTFAKYGRDISLAVSTPLIAADYFTNGTELQDRFFKVHDEVFQSAVDRWTPTPGEVGVAGQITGQLLATIPMVIASPAAAVAGTVAGVSEDLVREGVDPYKAITVGMVQGVGMGLGIYVPILGKSL